MLAAPIPAPRVCAFDFDGTLVDTMGEFANIAADVLQKNYAIPFAEARRRYLETSGIPFFQQLEIIRPGGPHNRAAAEEFEARKIAGFLDTRPSPDTVRGLAALRAAGLRLAVSSNNFQHLVDAFQARHALPMDLSLGFDAAAGSEKGRPHFDRICRELGVGPADILFCGDSLKDGERALEAGLRFAGITGTFARERFLERFPGVPVVDSILELSQRVLAGLRPA